MNNSRSSGKEKIQSDVLIKGNYKKQKEIFKTNFLGLGNNRYDVSCEYQTLWIITSYKKIYIYIHIWTDKILLIDHVSQPLPFKITVLSLFPKILDLLSGPKRLQFRIFHKLQN